jgi:hypothetical protein
MQIKKDTKVKVQYRPELGSDAVLQVAEASGGEYNVDVVFEKDGKRFLETFPQSSFLTAQVQIFFAILTDSKSAICDRVEYIYFKSIHFPIVFPYITDIA